MMELLLATIRLFQRWLRMIVPRTAGAASGGSAGARHKRQKPRKGHARLSSSVQKELGA